MGTVQLGRAVLAPVGEVGRAGTRLAADRRRPACQRWHRLASRDRAVDEAEIAQEDADGCRVKPKVMDRDAENVPAGMRREPGTEQEPAVQLKWPADEFGRAFA
jgi:hypothetical protein